MIGQKDRGVDDTRAFVLGTVAGLAEIVTEKFSLETLLDRTSLGRSAFGYFMKNVFAEASEEGASDLINWTADAIYDAVTGQERSEFKDMVRAYMAQGYSESEATGRAAADRLQELGLDALGGGLSGGLMSGGNMARTWSEGARLNAAGPDVAQSMVWDALNGEKGSEAYQQARAIQARLNQGKNATNWQTATLYQALEGAPEQSQVAKGDPSSR